MPKHKLVQWQHVREKVINPCGEGSPYWSWMSDRYAEETDGIESPSLPSIDSQLGSVTDALNDGAENLMSRREQTAFQLIVREGLSYKQTAKKMRVKLPTVYALIKRASKKLRILASIH